MDIAPCGCLLEDGNWRTATCQCNRRWFRSFDMQILEWEITLAEYQEAARETSLFLAIGANLELIIACLESETKDVAMAIEKILRDGQSLVGHNHALKPQLTRMLLYLTMLVTEADLSLEEIARGSLGNDTER